MNKETINILYSEKDGKGNINEQGRHWMYKRDNETRSLNIVALEKK
jgi:hypothetical protein